MRVLVAATAGVLLVPALAVFGWAVYAQDSDAPAEARLSKADGLLLRAIRYQGSEEFAKDGAIRDFVIRLACDVTRRDGDRTEKQDVTLCRFLRLLPKEQFRSETIVSGNKTIHGFNGRRFWLDNGETVTALNGSPYEKDRAEIKAEMRDTRTLLRLFLLSNLRVPGTRFSFQGRGVAKSWGRDHACDILHRQNLDPESSRQLLTIWLHESTGMLIKVRVHASGEPTLEPDRTFCFKYNEVAQPRCGKVLFPMKIEVRERAAGSTEDGLILKATVLETKGVELNNGIKDSLFEKPPRRQ